MTDMEYIQHRIALNYKTDVLCANALVTYEFSIAMSYYQAIF